MSEPVRFRLIVLAGTCRMLAAELRDLGAEEAAQLGLPSADTVTEWATRLAATADPPEPDAPET